MENMTTLEKSILNFIQRHPGATYPDICAHIDKPDGTSIMRSIIALKHGGMIEGHAQGYKAVMAEVENV